MYTCKYVYVCEWCIINATPCILYLFKTTSYSHNLFLFLFLSCASVCGAGLAPGRPVAAAVALHAVVGLSRALERGREVLPVCLRLGCLAGRSRSEGRNLLTRQKLIPEPDWSESGTDR